MSAFDTPKKTPKKYIDYGRDSHGVQRRRKPKAQSPNYVLRLNMIDAAAQVLDEIQTFTHPADAMLAHYFKRNAHLGQRDRGWIAGLVWHVLRHKRLLAQLAQSGAASFSRRLALLALARTQGLPACELHATQDERVWLERTLDLPIDSMAPAVRASLPDWLYAAIEAAYTPAQVATLCPALLQSAHLVLRANILKADRETIMAKLAYKQIPAKIHPLTPWAIALDTHPVLAKMDAYNDGWVEVQDAGSQVLALLTDAKRGHMVADFCAGAGGKTLALGAMMRNTGRLYAFDVNAARLKRLQPRLARSGLSNIAPIAIDSEADPKLKRLSGKFDRVLVDAPCSGMGTLRRNPDLKWRQHPRDVTELAAKQARILVSAARLVKPEGRLVYATCSLLPAENQDVVRAFLSANPAFHLISAAAECERMGVVLPEGAIIKGDMLQLLPTEDTFSSDGFFAAVMVRAVGTVAEVLEAVIESPAAQSVKKYRKKTAPAPAPAAIAPSLETDISLVVAAPIGAEIMGVETEAVEVTAVEVAEKVAGKVVAKTQISSHASPAKPSVAPPASTTDMAAPESSVQVKPARKSRAKPAAPVETTESAATSNALTLRPTDPTHAAETQASPSKKTPKPRAKKLAS
jgi:16S rRNA (cytosine967-C5)-methyltransferase